VTAGRRLSKHRKKKPNGTDHSQNDLQKTQSNPVSGDRGKIKWAKKRENRSKDGKSGVKKNKQ